MPRLRLGSSTQHYVDKEYSGFLIEALEIAYTLFCIASSLFWVHPTISPWILCWLPPAISIVLFRCYILLELAAIWWSLQSLFACMCQVTWRLLLGPAGTPWVVLAMVLSWMAMLQFLTATPPSCSVRVPSWTARLHPAIPLAMPHKSHGGHLDIAKAALFCSQRELCAFWSHSEAKLWSMLQGSEVGLLQLVQTPLDSRGKTMKQASVASPLSPLASLMDCRLAWHSQNSGYSTV